MNDMWLAVLFGTGILGLFLAWAMHSAVPIGVWLFSSVFWSSYGNALGVLDIVPAEFRLIGTAVMLFIWVGAVAGMFSGSG